MSRVGKQPIALAKGASVEINGTTVSVKGPKGSLTRTFPPVVEISQKNGQLTVTRLSDKKWHRAMHGTARSLIANMVTGVTSGYQKTLLIEGTGYRAETTGKNLRLQMGLSHPVNIEPPTGIGFEVPKGGKKIIISGIDKEVVGEIAAKIRSVRPPEPYKGKGIRYSDEKIRRKAGKAGKAK
ncbi:MAG: 50S ribosomal protein L6 [Ardenticatenaceae bacterium]